MGRQLAQTSASADMAGILTNTVYAAGVASAPAHAGVVLQMRALRACLSGDGGLEARLHDLVELLHVVGDAAPRAAQGECGADDERVVADLVGDLHGLLHRLCGARGRGLQPDLLHSLQAPHPTHEPAVLGQTGELPVSCCFDLQALKLPSFYSASRGSPQSELFTALKRIRQGGSCLCQQKAP